MPDINTAVSALVRISDALSSLSLTFPVVGLGFILSMAGIAIGLREIAKAVKGNK